MMFLAAALLQVTAAPVFAPPLDAPLRVVTERVETGTSARRFRMERLVRFAREEAGYRAEVVILGIASDTHEASGTLYESGFGSLAGQILVFHLDSAGRVLAIDDMARIWGRICSGVADNTAARRNLPSADRAALAKRLETPLVAMPADRQRELIGSLVAALVAEEAAEPVGTKPVRIPGALPFGGAVTMEGERVLSGAGDARMRSVTRASAEAPLAPEGSAPARAGRVEVEMRREFDSKSGLLTQSTDTTFTRVGSGAEARETRRVTTLQVAPIRPEAWPKVGR
ncbi:hypothetical protein IAG41_09930 [Sphingomonas sp. JC676]|uniref:hypothetical protein n=1 Tax=Sphingomonas sp. JC676 TaxID=2768065 RepID=UPI001657C21F|nr:hypothetical protein [Sphingomonas sp. JC676]MBC9032709.1 hypothetical protein [Sphingomonas sp. JC676]